MTMHRHTTDAPARGADGVTTLGALRAGQSAVILAIRHQKPTTRQKYLSRGLVPGARVSVVHHGDPLVVALDGCRWAIACAEAREIEVATVDTPAKKKWWHRLADRSRRSDAVS